MKHTKKGLKPSPLRGKDFELANVESEVAAVEIVAENNNLKQHIAHLQNVIASMCVLN